MSETREDARIPFKFIADQMCDPEMQAQIEAARQRLRDDEEGTSGVAQLNPEFVPCVSIRCEDVLATRYVSFQKEGKYPYCSMCAEILIRAGEIDRGPVHATNVEHELLELAKNSKTRRATLTLTAVVDGYERWHAIVEVDQDRRMPGVGDTMNEAALEAINAVPIPVD